MTVRPATINFKLYPYATFSEKTILKDGDDEPMDLTGYSARMHIRRNIDDADTLFDLTSEGASPDIVLGGADGSIEFSIAASATDDVPGIDWDGETWVYDLLLSSGGNVDRVYQGRIVVLPGVTRPS